MRYHERTKHQFNRYADGPGQLDWANQPNPFRRFAGAPLVHLPLLGAREAPVSPRYHDLYRRGSIPSANVTIHAISRLLAYALALSGLETSRRHALGAALQPVEWQPASDRRLPADRCAARARRHVRACTITRRASTGWSGGQTAARSCSRR